MHCNRCNQDKPESEFYASNKTRCRRCILELSAARRRSKHIQAHWKPPHDPEPGHKWCYRCRLEIPETDFYPDTRYCKDCSKPYGKREWKPPYPCEHTDYWCWACHQSKPKNHFHEYAYRAKRPKCNACRGDDSSTTPANPVEKLCPHCMNIETFTYESRNWCDKCIERTAQYRAQPVPDGHKRCARCLQPLPYRDFDTHARSRDGYRPKCRTCTRVAKLTGNPEQYISQLNERRTCLRCGRTKAVSDFHFYGTRISSFCKACAASNQ